MKMSTDLPITPPFDPNVLRDKWILVCRCSGIHRLPAYRRLASTGEWKTPNNNNNDDQPNNIPFSDLYVAQALPRPYALPTDSQFGLPQDIPYTGGYGAKLVFLHPFVAPWAKEVATDWIICPNDSDQDAAYNAVEQWIATQRADPNSQFPGQFDACVTFDDFSISPCAYIAEKLKLRTTPSAIINTIKNKYKLRQICDKIGIPVPRSLIVRLTDLHTGKLTSLFSQTKNNENQNDNNNNNNEQNQNNNNNNTNQTTITNNLSLPLSLQDNNNTNLTTPMGTTSSNNNNNNSNNGSNFKQRPPNQQLDVFTSTWFSDQHEITIDIPQNLEDEQEWAQYYAKKALELIDHPLQYPLVVKPFCGAGSNFVRKAYSYQDLIDILALFYQQCRNAGRNTAADICDALTMNSPSSSSGAGGDTNNAKVDKIVDDEEFLKKKWRYWGLDDLNTSFMVEECMIGQEFDLDMLIQDGEIKYLTVNDNHPTAGHSEYFQEAGGLVGSNLPFKAQLGVRVMVAAILKYFKYFCQKDNPQQKGIDGVWHFEGMVAKNMAWSKSYDYGIMAGNAGVHWQQNASYTVAQEEESGLNNNNNTTTTTQTTNFDNGNDDDYYVCMPIEINQRIGGAEVQASTTSRSGLDFIAENIKIHCGIEIPTFFSFLPTFHNTNNMAWDRFPASPWYRPALLKQSTRGDGYIIGEKDELYKQKYSIPLTIQQVVTNYQQSITPEEIQYVNEKYKDDPFDNTTIPNGEPLVDKLPSPSALQQIQETISYQNACELAEYYQNLLQLPTPHAYLPPGVDRIKLWRYVSSINWVPFVNGQVKKLHLPPTVLYDRSYIAHGFWYAPGDGKTLYVPPIAFDYLGYMVAGGNSPEEAHRNLVRLAAQLKYWLSMD